MLILLSPAKTLDMTPAAGPITQPRLLDDTRELATQLREHSRADLQDLMHVSEKLADLNYQRYQDFALPFTADNAKPAGLAFRGDVYTDLRADDFTAEEEAFANRQIRILSGLYGVLRPRDLMQAYRLEMGSRLATARGKNLYEFWGDRISRVLNEDLAEQNDDLILNLASQEYFKSVRPADLNGRVLTAHFKEKKGDRYRVVAFNAKRARGRMAHLIVREGITTAAPLRELVVNDYVYNDALSTGDDWVWTRE